MSVRLAGLTLIGLAAASFTTSLWRQLGQPRPDDTAKVVVMAPTEPPPIGGLALKTPTAVARADAQPSHRRLRPAPEVPSPPTPAEPAGPGLASATDAASDVAADAAATGPVETRPPPPPEPDLTPPF